MTTSDSNTMSAWRAEEVKNWTAALRNLGRAGITDYEGYKRLQDAMLAKLNQLLGIADEKGES